MQMRAAVTRQPTRQFSVETIDLAEPADRLFPVCVVADSVAFCRVNAARRGVVVTYRSNTSSSRRYTPARAAHGPTNNRFSMRPLATGAEKSLALVGDIEGVGRRRWRLR